MKKLLLITLVASFPLLSSQAIAENVFDSTGVNITLDSNSPIDEITINPPGTIETDDNKVTTPSANEPFNITTSVNSPLQEVENSANAEAEKLPDTEKQAEATNTEPNSKVIVQSGDSLSKIALRVYGDASRYREIVEANKDKYPSIEKNPDLIFAGWELDIPGSNTNGGEQTQVVANDENSSTSSSLPAVTIDPAADSSAQIVKIPNFTTEEKISRFQKSIDAANRTLFAQGKVIKVLTASVVRFLIDKNYLSEEEWMGMNPPVGYRWAINSLGKIVLEATSDKTNASATEIAEETQNSSSAEAVSKENEAKEKAEIVRLEKEAAEKEKERLAKEAAEKAKAEEAKKIQSEYSSFLKETGMQDFRANASDYSKALNAGFYLTVKGFSYDRGTKFYTLFHTQEDPEMFLPVLQQELVEANERYAKLKNNNSSGKFMDARDNDAEAALKVVNAKKAQLVVVWGMLTEALKQAEVDAETFRKSADTAEAKERLEHYDTLKTIFK